MFNAIHGGYADKSLLGTQNGIVSSTAPVKNYATGINSSGVISYAQPQFSDLSNYEEGTFTPALINSTPGDLAITYAVQGGSYTKKGNEVTLEIAILTSAFTHTTATGEWRISGLPFSSANNSRSSVSTLSHQGITKASYTQFYGLLDSNRSYILLAAGGSGVGYSAVSGTQMPSGGTVLLKLTITYFI